MAKKKVFQLVEKIAAERPAPERDVAYVQGVPAPDNLADLAKAYTSHVWSYAGIWAIASNLATLPILPYRTNKEGKETLYDIHPFFKVLSKPNPWMSQAMLKELSYTNLEIGGNAYWLLVRALGPKHGITDIHPLQSSKVKPVPSREKAVDHYLYHVNNKDTRYEADDILHFRYMNPTNDSWGTGSIAPAKDAISADIWAIQWNKKFFSKMGRPDAILETDKMLTPEIRKRMQEVWNQKFRGEDNRGGLAVLEEGLKYHEVNRTPAEMDFANLRKMAREEILAALGVPPAVVGLFEYANYANSREQRRLFWEHTLMPKARAFADTLTLRCAQLYPDLEDVTWAPDISGIEALRQDQLQLAQTAKLYVDMGFPPNAVANALDLPVDEFTGGESSRPVAAPGAGAPADPNAKNLTVREQVIEATDESIAVLRKEFGLTKARAAKRVSRWRNFEQLHAKHETAMQLAMKGFFRAQKRRVQNALNNHSATLFKRQKASSEIIISLLFDDKRETKALKDTATKYIRGPYLEFGIRAAKEMDNEFNFNLTSPRAISFIDNKTLNMAQEVNAYTKEQISDSVVDAIQSAVSEGFSESESIAQISDRIDEIYDFAQEGRAERIARTETIGAANAGAEEGMRQTGAEEKQWLSAEDDIVRDSHAAMDGQIVGINSPFTTPSGDALMYPGDPSGPVGEIVNCRCTVLPVVSDE